MPNPGPVFLLDVARTQKQRTGPGYAGAAPREVALKLYDVERDRHGALQKRGIVDRMVPIATAYRVHEVLRRGLAGYGSLAVTGDVLDAARAPDALAALRDVR